MSDQTVSVGLEGDAEDLKREVREAGDTIDELAGRTEEAGSRIEQVTSGVTSAWEDHSAAIAGTAVAVAGAGTAFEGLARSQQDTREVAGRLAGALEGETTDSVMGLAAEVHNATTDLDELVEMMEVGRQQGIRSADDLQDYALFWDRVGDATGEAAGQLAASSSALRAVGIDAGREQDALAAFGFITRETTSDVGEFLRFIERTGPELREMNADIDDAAAILGVLEGEFGMAGRTARQEFRTAVGESDGTLQGLLDTLGITTGQFDTYREAVAQSAGVIDENAEAYAQSRTRLQEWTAEVEAFLAEHSGLIEGLAALNPLLIGAGGTVFAIGQVIDAKRRWAGASGGLLTSLGSVARFLTGPWGVALAGAGGLVWAFADAKANARQASEEFAATLDDETGALTENSREHAVNILAREGLLDVGRDFGLSVETMVDALLGEEWALRRVSDATRENRDAHVNWAGTAEGAKSAGDRLLGTLGFYADAHADAAEKARETAEATAEAEGRFLDFEHAIRAGVDPAIAGAIDRAEGWTGAADDAAGEADEFASGLDDVGDEAGQAAAGLTAAEEALKDYLDTQRGALDPMFGLLDALEDVAEAQSAYNDTLDDAGQPTADSEQAALDLARAIARAERAALDGDLSFDDFTRQLDLWVEGGLITADVADLIAERVAAARGEAEQFRGSYRADLELEMGGTLEQLREVNRLLEATRGVTVDARSGAVLMPGQTRRAAGGPLDAFQPSVVGEFGTELFVPAVPGEVLPAPDTQRLMGGGEVRVTVHTTNRTVLDGRVIAEEFETQDTLGNVASRRSRLTAGAV